MTRREKIYNGLIESYSDTIPISNMEKVLDLFPSVKNLFHSLSNDISIDIWNYKNDNAINLKVFEQSLIKYDPDFYNMISDYNEKGNIYLTDVNIEKVSVNNYYVYALIDSSNGKVFYVGKGMYNRIYQHDKDIKESEKRNYIKKIKEGNIHYWIIKNNLEPGVALSLESYLINKIKGLTNIVKPMITFEYIMYLELNYFYQKYGKLEFNYE